MVHGHKSRTWQSWNAFDSKICVLVASTKPHFDHFRVYKMEVTLFLI